MTAGISLIPGKTGAHRASLQLDSPVMRYWHFLDLCEYRQLSSYLICLGLPRP